MLMIVMGKIPFKYNDIRMLTIKQDAYKKYVTDVNITALSSFYVGKQPIFDLSKKQEQKKIDKEKKKKLENGVSKNGTTPNKNGKVKKTAWFARFNIFTAN